MGVNARFLVGESMHTAVVRDISSTGALLISELVIPVGTELTLAVDGGGFDKLRLKAKVVSAESADYSRHVALAVVFVVGDDTAAAMTALSSLRR